MGKLLLCTGKRAEIPFAFPGGHVNLYSIEELCYYLYHNIFNITDEMIDSRLVNFLHDQLDMKFLAGRIESLIKINSFMGEKVMAIMASSNYYTGEELTEFREKVNSIGNLTLEERLKFRGDSYLKNKQYPLAIKQYLELLNAKNNPLIDHDIYAKTWHNLGVAYMRVFLFEEAVKCFESAYKISEELVILESFLKSLKITEKEEMYQEVIQGIDEEIRGKWESKWEQLQFKLENKEEFKGEVSTLISEWKQEYRVQMT
ncbi:MAG: tetratricopeptide repeat protein [Clostridiales bacterium]|nr:tetratricopeptide repeat protein [Clostridiales bacterium]